MAGTETASARYRGLDTWSDDDILEAFWDGQARAVAAVRPALPQLAAAARAAIERLDTGGRIVYVGAGTSGRLAALDGMELGSTFDFPDDRVVLLLAEGPALRTGRAGGAEDDTDAAIGAVRDLRPNPSDVFIGVAASGTTPFTLAALAEARRSGALTIAIANNPDTPLLREAGQMVLLDTGPEVIGGSTRLNAGTAQKAALGMLSSLIMTRLGHVMDGLMVNLRAENAKLRKRAVGMLVRLTGCSPDDAAQALEAGRGRVKTAALILRGLSPGDAEQLLAQERGRLRAALARIA